MAEFIDSLNSIKPSSLPFIEVDQSLDIMNQFEEFNGSSVMDNSNFMGFSNDNFFGFPFLETLCPIEFQKPPMGPLAGSSKEQSKGDKKRKASVAASDTNSGDSSVLTPSEIKKKNSSGSGKRSRSNPKELGEKPKEVVHVRARRGQATDSHSLAERARREKINERMRCLQDLVPGCYKTVGMAGMLDEIINYVQSLQNQVEFLSMKLSAASTFYDFNLEMEAIAMPQLPPKMSNGYNADADRAMRNGYGGCSSSHTTMPPF